MTSLCCVTACLQAGTEGGPPGGVTGWDEEDERLLWSMQLEAAALKALDARPVLDQELQLLQRAGGGTQQQQHSSQALADARSSSAARLRAQLRQQQEQQATMQAAMAQRLSDIAGQLSLSRDKDAIRQQVGCAGSAMQLKGVAPSLCQSFSAPRGSQMWPACVLFAGC